MVGGWGGECAAWVEGERARAAGRHLVLDGDLGVDVDGLAVVLRPERAQRREARAVRQLHLAQEGGPRLARGGPHVGVRRGMLGLGWKLRRGFWG